MRFLFLFLFIISSNVNFSYVLKKCYYCNFFFNYNRLIIHPIIDFNFFKYSLLSFNVTRYPTQHLVTIIYINYFHVHLVKFCPIFLVTEIWGKYKKPRREKIQLGSKNVCNQWKSRCWSTHFRESQRSGIFSFSIFIPLNIQPFHVFLVKNWIFKLSNILYFHMRLRVFSDCYL